MTPTLAAQRGPSAPTARKETNMTPEQIKETLHLHKLWLSGDANLRGADLRYANLRDANLRGANLWGAVGNMREIKSLQIDTWAVTYTADKLQIGCQRHSIELWRKSDPRWIAAMDPKVSEWWDKFGAIVLGLIDASPATPTERKPQ